MQIELNLGFCPVCKTLALSADEDFFYQRMDDNRKVFVICKACKCRSWLQIATQLLPYENDWKKEGE